MRRDRSVDLPPGAGDEMLGEVDAEELGRKVVARCVRVIDDPVSSPQDVFRAMDRLRHLGASASGGPCPVCAELDGVDAAEVGRRLDALLAGLHAIDESPEDREATLQRGRNARRVERERVEVLARERAEVLAVTRVEELLRERADARGPVLAAVPKVPEGIVVQAGWESVRRRS